ncbi:PREDICTED: protein cereblon isoform X1 [Acromyrmex echinatior]|uniref:protein cereblon isoform X1 n=2 Tax=Acromyrmex echinatior TaxID=103372 RepID=UPI000580F8BB|nr:PREDICTED: protein cereblon isoform X1 [Acromyrmex echinatior]
MDIDEDYDTEQSDYGDIPIVESPHSGPDEDHENWSDVSTVELDLSSNRLEPNMDDIPVPSENTFDVTLPAAHSYLGQNLEELRGRTILDDGIYINLPLLVKQSVLFPGQTLPMTVFGTQTIEMLQTCIQNDRTFGVVCYGNPDMERIGTTAEIYEYTDGGIWLDHGRREFRLKAKGRQRFKILRIITQDNNKISANVKVLPEITLEPPFLDQRLASLDHLRISVDSEEDMKKQERIENLDAAVTAWPAWVYRQYDPIRLSFRIRQHLQFLETRGGSVPKNPIDLSFWVAQNILMDHNERLTLLTYDCAISRLQREIKYLVEDKIYVCVNCESFIGRQSHMFPMNKEGPQGTYVNPGGVIHETITFYHVQGVVLNNSDPSTEYSWFPGYAWTIAICKGCRHHVGWKFTAVQSNLRPKEFWGLTRRSLKNKDLKIKKKK